MLGPFVVIGPFLVRDPGSAHSGPRTTRTRTDFGLALGRTKAPKRLIDTAGSRRAIASRIASPSPRRATSTAR
ncbi:MAG: hypothetical protein DMF94_08335 [Acidobacteria bacterium]|nr:MAG: hypothetical protein DMF94_08335 [Acidobacteriota bacterium]